VSSLQGAQLTLPRSGTALSPVVQFPKLYKKKKTTTCNSPQKIGLAAVEQVSSVAENWVPVSSNQSAVHSACYTNCIQTFDKSRMRRSPGPAKTCLLQKKSLYWEFSLSRHLGARKLLHRPLRSSLPLWAHRSPPDSYSSLLASRFVLHTESGCFPESRRWKWTRCNITNTVCLKVECFVTPASVTLGKSGRTLKSPDGPVPTSTGHSMQIISILFSVIDWPV
jgi:hypothetical protein